MADVDEDVIALPYLLDSDIETAGGFNRGFDSKRTTIPET
jgi:hypothetical protein